MLDGKDEQLDQILTNIQSMTADIKASTPKFKKIMESLETTSDEIAQLDLQSLTSELTKTINELKTTLAAIQNGEGTLGKMATDDELWNNLNETTKNLDSLVNDIMTYPRRYTGITEKQRSKGDKQKEVNEGIDLPDETKIKK
jgi:phospholipid/cholesterol/gamma-HCH transport system substrate-binding protein